MRVLMVPLGVSSPATWRAAIATVTAGHATPGWYTR